MGEIQDSQMDPSKSLETKAMAEKDSRAVAFDKTSPKTNYIEKADEESGFHARTWTAMIAMCFLNMVPVFALQGPPEVLCCPVDDESRMVDQHRAAKLHSQRFKRQQAGDLDSECALPRTGASSTSHCVCVRRIPVQKNDPGWLHDVFLHWSSNSTGFNQYL